MFLKSVNARIQNGRLFIIALAVKLLSAVTKAPGDHWAEWLTVQLETLEKRLTSILTVFGNKGF